MDRLPKQRIRPDITGWKVFAIARVCLHAPFAWTPDGPLSAGVEGAPVDPAPLRSAKPQAGAWNVPSTTVTAWPPIQVVPSSS
ncbi:hypothetical protein FEQ05_05693 [Burkholderia pseudomultivorans]|uniref:Uncharacterized protein n=1 Tax=Burkholderia pseudomultivorans TaxID=1207504 RepID=A0A6P2R3L5_9BURK|nr:hypothetical protein [Burkholderia pseudomultivorans]MDR8739031.1 hypothetical protein [Burkholderia pseudomultivorans]MDR8745461.1 hypothetical protein [Burkholderia pseudomultivorans]MDR8757684.1 hypothetical protein [Burkholderia pseudomultivorans]MDR8781814.1 hypothetical protein [Burkholderia pseudomultivorans]